MKAMVLTHTAQIETEPLRLMKMPEPIPGAREVRIKVAACGICRTDLHVIEGELPMHTMPIIPGHQAAGVIDAIGESVARFKIGDRAGVMWMHETCGVCSYCKSGNENLCDQARFTGYDAMGGYAEYVTVQERFACKIPQGFDDLHAAPLLCAGIIGYRSYRLSGAKPGCRLGLYGFGASAHITLQVAIHAGCDAYVFTRNPRHQALAKSLGAIWTGESKDRPSASMDASIIFAPAGELVPEALAALKKGGTVALAGIYMTPIPEMSYELIYGERILRSVANATVQDAEELLALAPQIPIKTEIETYPLDQANKALRILKESRHQGAGVLII